MRKLLERLRFCVRSTESYLFRYFHSCVWVFIAFDHKQNVNKFEPEHKWKKIQMFESGFVVKLKVI